MNSTDHRPLLKKKRFWIGLSGLLLISAVVGFSLLEYYRTEAMLTALRDAGLPTTSAEQDQYYVIPEGYPDTTDQWVRALVALEAANRTAVPSNLPIVGTEDSEIPPPGEPWDKLQEAKVWLSQRSNELQLVAAAAMAGGRVRFPIDLTMGINTLLPQAQQTRDAARLLRLNAAVNAHEGEFAAAQTDLVFTLQLAEAMWAEPVLITQLIRMAIHGIACDGINDLLWHTEWNDQQLAELQLRLREVDFRQALIRAMHGERAMFFSALDTVTLGPFRNSNIRQGIVLFDTVIEGLEKDWAAGIAAGAQATEDLRGLSANSKLQQMRSLGVLLLMPATEQAISAGARSEAQQRCTILALAIRRHWLKTGKVVDDLSQLPDELIGENADQIRRDPFNGQPLLFQRDEHQFTIYSVGENQVDDGGKVEADGGALKDIGFTIITQPANDGAAESANTADQPATD